MSRETTHERPDLNRLQRWMQEVVVHPGTVEDAIASSGAVQEIPAENLACRTSVFLISGGPRK